MYKKSEVREADEKGRGEGGTVATAVALAQRKKLTSPSLFVSPPTLPTQASFWTVS